MRLPTRLALVGVAVLTLTLTAVGLLTYQLVRVSGRQDIDRLLRSELDGVVSGLPEELPQDGEPTLDDLRAAADRYLALHPGSARHLAVIAVDGNLSYTSEGPAELVDLVRDGRLPEGEPGRLRTVETPAGPVRVLASPIEGANGRLIGTTTIVGSLRDARREASSALTRVAAAGVVGLVVGGLALTLATRRAVAPIGTLAAAARATGTGPEAAARRVPVPERRDELGVLAHEFNRMLDRIEAGEEERRRLLAAVSHELRTPLAVAQGHLEMFESVPRGDDAARAELAAVLRGELDRLARVVGDLTTVAAGDLRHVVQPGPVFVPDVLDDLRDRLPGLGLDHVTVADAAAPVVVSADQDRLAQSLLNLVVNADLHTPDGTSVTVTAEVGDGVVALAVRDDGPGLDPAVRDRAFEPFASTRPNGPRRSSGLGLTVVKTLTEAQGGTVELDTGPAGTTITLRFPLLD